MITSELFPLAKAGGLADAVADISLALAARGHDVRAILPRYYFIDRVALERLPVQLSLDPDGTLSVFQTHIGDEHGAVPVYLIDHEAAYGRDGIYGPPGGTGFTDNAWRFSLLPRAALELSRHLGWKPDVFHSHDWPAALTAAYLVESPYVEWFRDSRTTFTIHNLGYQGRFSFAEVSSLRLLPSTVLTSGLVEGDHLNFLKGALTGSDALTTVSPTYAREIQTPELGFGLDPFIRGHRRGITGILNGINYETWNPATDPLIPLHYDAEHLEVKKLLARVLRWFVGLPQPEEGRRPIIGMVSRLVGQKGIEELLAPEEPALVRILTRLEVQVVILGSTDAARERTLLDLADSFDNLSVTLGFDNRLAHLIEAASDFFLMPSRYEPCGLNQMYSMRYGTIPIVTHTGGLADTVVDVLSHPDRGTGYVIPGRSSRAIYETVSRAVADYSDAAERIEEVRRRGMRQEFTWERAAAEYEKVYRGLLG